VLCELQAVFGQFVDMWCAEQLLTVTAQIAVAQVIGQDKDYVWPQGGCIFLLVLTGRKEEGDDRKQEGCFFHDTLFFTCRINASVVVKIVIKGTSKNSMLI